MNSLRNKNRKPTHTVPLSRQAIAVLKELQSFTGHCEHLFPGRNREGSTISENTVLKVIDNLGYKGRMTGHGFRSVASTYLNNLGTIRPDMIEAQLAHGDRNQVRAAYNRADYMEYRYAHNPSYPRLARRSEHGQPLPAGVGSI